MSWKTRRLYKPIPVPQVLGHTSMGRPTLDMQDARSSLICSEPQLTYQHMLTDGWCQQLWNMSKHNEKHKRKTKQIRPEIFSPNRERAKRGNEPTVRWKSHSGLCPGANRTVDAVHRTVEFTLLPKPGNKSYGGVVFMKREDNWFSFFIKTNSTVRFVARPGQECEFYRTVDSVHCTTCTRA